MTSASEKLCVKMPVHRCDRSHLCNAVTKAQSPDVFILCDSRGYRAFGFARTQASFYCRGLKCAPFSWKIDLPTPRSHRYSLMFSSRCTMVHVSWMTDLSVRATTAKFIDEDIGVNLRDHFTCTRMTKIKKTDNNKCWRERGECINTYIASDWEPVQYFLQMINIELP